VSGFSRTCAVRPVWIVALLLSACHKPTPTAGFWFNDTSFALPAKAAEKLGGLLTDAELETIKTISRGEVERAFAGFRIQISNDHTAFWRVAVMRSLRGRGPLPNAGESMPLGFLGGSGGVSFDLVALKAIQYAPEGASRQTIIEGIGRGIGRVAAHEFGHQILGIRLAHNSADENSYEYPSPDRAAQYYGHLHWTSARPLLEQKLR
jgi:hypothetical protein